MGGIFYSTDLGSNWNSYNNDVPYPYFSSVIPKNGKIIASTETEGILISTDNGNSWEQEDNELINIPIKALWESGNTIYAGTQNGMYISESDGQLWKQTNSPFNGHSVNFLSGYNSCIFSGSDENGFAMHETIDTNWRFLNNGLGDTAVYAAIVGSTNAFIGTSGQGIWKRPLTEIFNLKINPDTLLVSQLASEVDTLYIHTSVNWTIIGSIPTWLSMAPLSGTGETKVVCRTLLPNTGVFKKYSSFFLYSQITGSIAFSIIQKGKSDGISETSSGMINVYPIPSSGTIRIESSNPLTKLTLYNSFGINLKVINEPGADVIMDLSGEGTGVYYIHIEGENWGAVRKIVIL
jgi:hypothetical protein